MKEITFFSQTSKLTRTIKVCETQNELVGVIREHRNLKNGSVFVIYNNGASFFQLFGSDGWRAGYFKRFGIMSATVSSFSGELFVFGDFAITPDGCVCIGEDNIKKYGLYSGQYDVNLQANETDTDETDVDDVTFDEMRQAYNKAIDNIEYNMRPIDKICQAYNKAIDDIKHNSFIDEECRQAVICSKIKQLDFINDLWEHGVYYDSEGFFSRKVNSYNLKTGDFDITVEPLYFYEDCPYNYNVISSDYDSTIRFALYLLGR